VESANSAPARLPGAARPLIAEGIAAKPDRRRTGSLAWALEHARIVFGLAIIALVTASAILAPWLSPQSPETQLLQLRLAPPGPVYLLGGDSLGRDVLSRVIWAGRVSLSVGLISMLIAIVAGVAIGSLAGYFGGLADNVLMRFTDVVLVFPTFFLLILMVATFGRSLELLILMIGVTSWPTNARVVRALTLRLRRQDFVTAAEVAGAGHARIVLHHLIPHLIPVIIASATIRVASNILVEAGLSYLGLGVGEPTPSWGNMVSAGASYVRQAPWLVAVPGSAIFVVVLAFNLLGEGLRDLLNPREQPR
jgi:peptide/nickel transport system permease protein